MEMTRGASPPSPIHIHAPSPSSARRPSEQHGPPPGWHPRHSLPTPMTIPGSTRGREPPPPLPPPRYLHNHAAGSDDPGWSWSNPHRGGFDKSRPSNVIASQHPRPWTDLLDDDEIAPDQVSARRRQSSSATVHSMKDSDRRYDAGLDEGYYSLSVTSSANPQSVTFFILFLSFDFFSVHAFSSRQRHLEVFCGKEKGGGSLLSFRSIYGSLAGMKF